MNFWYTMSVDCIRDILADICLIGAAAFSVAWVLLVNRGRLARTADRIARTPRSAVAAFLFFAAVATVCAQKSGTNGLMRTTEHAETAVAGTEDGWRRVSQRLPQPPFRVAEGVSAPSVVEMFRLESETTNETYSYAMPTNGTRCEKWWRRGAYEDVLRLDLGDFRFPLGTNLCDSLWVYTWGMAGARLRDASNRVVATGVPMSAVPYLSQFWDAPTTNGTHLLTWENFFLNRDTNTPVSAQLELMASGDFIARSNLVERIYRRVNPDDWDGDGIQNDYDFDPYVCDGDNYGPHQTLPQGANSNAYCWVDVVVSQADSLVTFTGDGYSALPDPAFIAKAGETNRVTLLIGKTYQVTCPMPIACVGQSSDEIDVDQDSPTEMYVCWPVEIYADEIQTRGGAMFSMVVTPDWLGGGFTWTNSCCSISSSGDVFAYSCGGTCTCAGCGALGYYGYESYRLPAGGGSCGCSGHPSAYGGGDEEVDDGPYAAGASATFSKSAVIFEDGYENTPGVWVGRQSTKTELHCVAHGGPNGGHVRFEIVGEEKLGRVSGISLPLERDVGPGNKVDFTIVYNGKQPSGTANDIVVTSTFTENVAGATPVSSQEKLTSIRVKLESTIFSLDECPNRHIRGIGEPVSCEWTPSVSGLSFQTRNGAVCTDSYNNSRNVTCPFHAASEICEISVGDVTHTPAVQVFEPTGIEARNPHKLSYSVPPNSPGGAGFSMELYIMPDTVSFQALDFWERPAYDSTIEGYFTNQAFQAVWYHDTSMSAGVWHRISGSNYWFMDTAQMGDELITPVYPGRLVWHIPVDWRKRDDSTVIHQDFKSVDQTFEMSATGRLTVYKYQHWVAREISGEALTSEGMTK